MSPRQVVLFAANFLTHARPRYNLVMPSSKKSSPRERRRTELRNRASRNLDHMSSLAIVRLMNREDRHVGAAIARQLPAISRAVDGIVDRIRRGGRLLYIGAGTSASECPPTFGVSPKLVHALIAGGPRAIQHPVEGAEDNRAQAVRDLRKIHFTRNDVLVGLAASGTTPYVLSAVGYARQKGALTIGVTANPSSPIVRAVKIAIAPNVGPEVLTGSTRLKAGTAQKMVLNMLSTASMVRLGHVYDNLMIDLTRTNKKLKDRAGRILTEASGKELSAVEHALRQSEHNLRVALVMLKRGFSAELARKALYEAGGNLRRALAE